MPYLAELCLSFLWDCVPLLILALSVPESTGFGASSGLADYHYVRFRHFMTAEPSSVVPKTATNHVQKICDRLAQGARPGDLEKLFMAVEAEQFSQAGMWAKAWAPMRCVVAQVPDTWCVSALILPRGGKVGWQRHDKADSISTAIFGNLVVTDVELQDSDESRKLEQRELEAAHADAWAIGGSDESDCVCRGGRCPRMWDCPFWVDRRRAEAKGSCAHVASRVLRETSNRNIWKSGRQTVRSLEALEPSTLLEIHVGQRSTRYYKEIPSTLGDVVELIEIMEPLGVKPGVCRYVGPAINLPQ